MEKRFRKKLLHGFSYALSGILHAFRHERNIRIHISIAILVIIAGILFRITPVEWTLLLLCISTVICAEMTNTAIELLADRITLEKDRTIKTVKDISAGMVLISAIFAAVIGIITFLPYIIKLLRPC